jgi:hypothetical protein
VIVAARDPAQRAASFHAHEGRNIGRDDGMADVPAGAASYATP